MGKQYWNNGKRKEYVSRKAVKNAEKTFARPRFEVRPNAVKQAHLFFAHSGLPSAPAACQQAAPCEGILSKCGSRLFSEARVISKIEASRLHDFKIAQSSL